MNKKDIKPVYINVAFGVFIVAFEYETIFEEQSSRHLLIQGQQWKHHKNVWNLSKSPIKRPERRPWPCCGIIVISFK